MVRGRLEAGGRRGARPGYIERAITAKAAHRRHRSRLRSDRRYVRARPGASRSQSP